MSYLQAVFLILPIFCWMSVKTMRNTFGQMRKLETWAWIGGIELLVIKTFSKYNLKFQNEFIFFFQLPDYFIQVLSFFHRIFLSGLLIALIAYEYIILKGMHYSLKWIPFLFYHS